MYLLIYVHACLTVTFCTVEMFKNHFVQKSSTLTEPKQSTHIISFCVCVFQSVDRFKCTTDKDCHQHFGSILSNGESHFSLSHHDCKC